MDHQEYNAYQRVYQLHRYHARMASMHKMLGGLCVRCGSDEKLEIDHIVPTEKSFTIGSLWGIKGAALEKELEKCQLLCKSCHIDKTLEDEGKSYAQGTHGTLSAIRYCKPLCDLCRNVKNAYSREWKRKRKLCR